MYLFHLTVLSLTWEIIWGLFFVLRPLLFLVRLWLIYSVMCRNSRLISVCDVMFFWILDSWRMLVLFVSTGCWCRRLFSCSLCPYRGVCRGPSSFAHQIEFIYAFSLFWTLWTFLHRLREIGRGERMFCFLLSRRLSFREFQGLVND